MMTTVTSALADIADENELQVRRAAGRGALRDAHLLPAGRPGARNRAGGLGAERDRISRRTPSRAKYRTTSCMALAAAFALSAIPGMIAGIFYAMLRVTRATYDETRAALDERAAAEAMA